MDFYDKIEDYINQTLTDDERQAFDTALVSDIRLQRSVVEQRILFDAMRRDRLKSKIERIVDKLPKPETPVVNIKTVKKNNYWWAAAAAVLLIGVGIWWSQNSMIRSRYRMAQKQPPTTPTDTMIKNEVKTPQNIATVEPKQTPQYPTTKKVEKPVQQGNTPQKEPNPIAKTDESMTNEPLFAEVKKIVTEENINRSSRGQKITETDKSIRPVLDALANHQPNEAIRLLKNESSEEAEFYRALAYLLTNREIGKKQLEAIAGNVEHEFRFKAQALLGNLK